jgi:hypothetical protein
MQRRPSTQDVSWLLDLERNNQLNLNPSYQRKSVWTRKDKQFFLDTIFRNFPSPAIFLHKTISETGQTRYAVVDGKQRITTIIEFISDTVRIASDYGDSRLDSKKWSDLQGDIELNKALWNYQITVEIIDFDDSPLINQVFDRLNRNSRRLTDQELRHAKFDGWLIRSVEAEIERPEWRTLGIVTNARSKRMADAQFMSELYLVALEKKILGFDQDQLDNFYAKYDELDELAEPIEPDAFSEQITQLRTRLSTLDGLNQIISKSARALAHIYTIWGLLVLHSDKLPTDPILASKIAEFMDLVEDANRTKNVTAWLDERPDQKEKRQLAFDYWNASRGASTDLTPRTARDAAMLLFIGS